MEPSKYCEECNNVAQYCKKDSDENHEHLYCEDCMEIHNEQQCWLGKDDYENGGYIEECLCGCVC